MDASLSRDLVAWFRAHRRDLPWRHARTPYRVWLSEVMLQQTRVSVVVDYFERFTARFPTVDTLAQANEDDVLSLWSGLGYYSRGRNLHRAAQAVMQQHGGAFPSTSAALAALPGVGPYTAAAVASLAFGERVAVVDGNVARVMARLHDDALPVDDSAGRARIAARAQALVDVVDAGGDPGEVNEGLMELGATVCTPRSPTCGACPWRSSCQALAHDTVEQRPVKSPKKARKAMRVASVVVVDAANPQRVWLEKRAERGLFGGLWAPPSRTIAGAEDARAGWQALLAERGIDAPRALPAPVVVERTLTHRDLTFYVARVTATSTNVMANGAWFDDVSTVGTSTAVRAVLAAVSPLPLFG
jgi:A/G-specific adenine glycosylase